MAADEQSLQERYAPNTTCFGCGPKNAKGLRIRSFARGEKEAAGPGEALPPGGPSFEEVVATWRAEPHHEAFPGVLNGGIVGALLDCHSNWTAAWHLMRKRGAEKPPVTVTAEYAITLRRPAPSSAEIHLRARPVDSTDDRVVVEGSLTAGGTVCATSRGTFVAVEPGHPAYHRW